MLRVITLILLVSLVTPDSVTHYVKKGNNNNVLTVDSEDTSPVLHVVGSAGYVLKMARDLMEEEVKSVLDNGNILRGVRLASLTLLGLYILSSLAGMIVPILLFYAIYSIPNFIDRFASQIA